jgi:hypothetical protein
MSRLGHLFSRRRRYDELSESIREHLDEKIADLIDRGMTPEQAEQVARREFGNVTRIEQSSREVWQWPTLESLWADLKYSLRRLRRGPLFTAVCLITLAVAVGANTVRTDTYEKRPVVIVSKKFTSEYWTRPQDALGQRIRVVSTDPWREIIGVSEDVHYDGVEKPSPPMVYWPLLMNGFAGHEQRLQRATVFVVRSQLAGTQSMMKAVQQQVWTVNPNVPLANSETLGDLYSQSMARTSFTLVMLCVSAGIALLLGTVGIYGVIAYSVSRRTREIGIRMALGAQRGIVVGTFVRQTMWLTAVGIAIGLVVSSATMRFMSSLLYGVSAGDPITYITITFAVVIAALLACYYPRAGQQRLTPCWHCDPNEFSVSWINRQLPSATDVNSNIPLRRDYVNA